MAAMDRFEGRCWLDWWANSSTNFGDIEVSIVITPTDTGWNARGQLIDLTSDDELEGFALLCQDPRFTLRFQDGSTIEVILARTDDRHFTLSEYSNPTERQVTHRVDL